MSRFGAFLKDALGGSKPNRETVDQIKSWARTALGGSSEIAFSINEIACTDPSCPGVETIILVMEPGRKTRACKVAKMLADVTAEDVVEALSP